MSENVDNQSSRLDGLKWGLVAILIAAAIVGNNIYSDVSIVVRVIGVIVALLIAFAVAFQTGKGKQAFSFFRESRMEVRKVVWPTRQEATQTTLIVLAATAVMALVLWGLDGILVRIVAFITGIGI
ncbi:preprotein translocase subunit SecE [Alginatibacterium sediminis]|uniref:Protein translocase subunit SecE n=1 Tax=Alginatibacterium sediminis TaxID=2164068 RepID=A0A420EL93_9ALTE|nr:preprotein translocase subunit SecE [Alginatibacterium sediminis]RKF21400.1 preprotein translocase subunit SecE [Alginatibacterium sediminis]